MKSKSPSWSAGISLFFSTLTPTASHMSYGVALFSKPHWLSCHRAPVTTPTASSSQSLMQPQLSFCCVWPFSDICHYVFLYIKCQSTRSHSEGFPRWTQAEKKKSVELSWLWVLDKGKRLFYLIIHFFYVEGRHIVLFTNMLNNDQSSLILPPSLPPLTFVSAEDTS